MINNSKNNYGNNTVWAIVAMLILFSFSFAEPKSPYPIIFIHGLASSDETWDDVIEDLDDHFTLPPNHVISAVLNAQDDMTDIDGGDGELTGDPGSNDDVWVQASNPGNGDIFTVNFNVGISNGQIVDEEGWSPDWDESDSNESAIYKQGFALKKIIERVLDATGADKVILVGHSMGGLAAREYLQRKENGEQIWWQEGGHKVAKVVTIGTPHLGSNLAEITRDSTNSNRTIDLWSEAARDIRYSYKKNINGTDYFYPGVYLFGGLAGLNEYTISLYSSFHNYDVDCDGDETSVINSLNDENWEYLSHSTNPNMQLPQDIDYTWITSDVWGYDGDGTVDLERQYLTSKGDTLKIASCHGCRILDNCIGDCETENTYAIIRGLDEPDSDDLAYELELNTEYNCFLTYQSGNSSLDYDWYKFYLDEESGVQITIEYSLSNASSNTVRLYDNSLNVLQQIYFNDSNLTTGECLSNGDYYIRIKGYAQNNSWNNPYTIKIKKNNSEITPSISNLDCWTSSSHNTEIVENNWQDDGSVSFTWSNDISCLSNQNYYYKYNSNSSNSISGDENNITSTNYNQSLDEGTRYFHVKPKSDSGKWGSEIIFTIKYDNTAPNKPNITNGPSHDWSTVNEVTFYWETSSDGQSGFSHFEGGIDDSFDDLGSITNKTYTVSDDGPHEFKIKALDNAGNESDVDSYAIKIDANPPSVNIQSPNPNNDNYINTTSVIINWQGGDGNGSGINYYQSKLDNGSWQNEGSNTSRDLNLNEGVYTFYVKAIDYVNYTSEIKEVEFTIDLTPPPSPSDLFWDSSPYSIDSEITAQWGEPSDNLTGISAYHIQISTSAEFADTLAENSSFTSIEYTYDEGEHNTFYYFRLKARDGAGNWSSDWSYISDGIWVDLFSDPPQISNYSTTESSWRNDSTIQIVWEPTDLSGIASYEYKWQNITDGTETDWDTLYPPQTSLIDTLSDGKWIFYLRNTDALEGQDPSETVEYHLWIDTEAPGAPIGLSVQPIEWTNVNTLTVSWQTNPDDLSGIEAVRYQFENTTTWGMEDSISSKSFPITYPPEGITSTYIVLEDSAGNWLEANADTITVKYDITNPQLGSISWVDSTTHQTDSITFSLNDTLTLEWDSFEDDISGIEQFELNIITEVDTLIIFNESISGLEIDSNRTFSGLANHTTYFYQFNAIDSAGNVSEDIQPQFVTIDTIALPPAIDSLSTHLDNVWSNTDEVRLVFKPLDPSGIHLYYYKWYEDTVWDSTFSEHADFIELSDGKHTLQIKNMDATEVWVSDSIEHHIWIDTTPPNQPEISELSIDTLDNSFEISVSWSESVELSSETTSGFEKYYYTFVKDFPLARSITIDSTWSETTDTTIDLTIESEGIWEFMVAGSDVAQNYSEITYRTLPVDFGPPNPPDSLGYTVEIISATLTWRKNTEGDIIKYHIYQKLLSSSGDYDWVEIGTTPYQVINFIVEDLPGPSMYYFSIRAEDLFTNMSDFSETINVWYEPPLPHAEFQITYSEIFPLEIIFEDKSDSAAVNLAFWNWDFGDSTTSIEQHPTYQYIQNGEYTVTLKVIDEWGMSDDTSTTITLLPEFLLPLSPMLLETFVNEPTSQELIIQNIGYGYLQWGYSVDGQLPDEFEISCGIENLSRSEGYSLALPQLMVENKVDTIIVPIYLSTVDTLKRLDFTIVDTPNELIGDTVNTAIQGLIITYEDNFGKLDVTIESYLTHMIHPGENMPICEVLFRVNDSLSNTSIDLNLIDVSLINIDGAEVEPVSVTSGIIYYQSLYTLNPRSEEICEITYTPIDTYDDTAEISFFIDDIDSVDTVFTIVGVGIAKVGPLASFAAEYDGNRYTPLEVYFNNSTVLGTNDNATYNWENNNVVFSNDYSPTETFHYPGNYNIKLTVTTDHGQPDSTNTLIEVIAPPPTSFSLLSPPDSISEFDRSCGVITFEWESSIDTNNHEIKYDLHLFVQNQSGELLFSIIEESIQDTFFTFSDTSNLVLDSLVLDSTYYWKVTANNGWSSIECEEIFNFHFSDKEICLNNARLILFPTEFEINTIYPNPFNPVANIQFSTPEAANVYIHIYDLSGREVALLSEGHYPPGYHEVQWQANDFSSGIYFVHLTASSSRGDVLFNISKKVMLLK